MMATCIIVCCCKLVLLFTLNRVLNQPVVLMSTGPSVIGKFAVEFIIPPVNSPRMRQTIDQVTQQY